MSIELIGNVLSGLKWIYDQDSAQKENTQILTDFLEFCNRMFQVICENKEAFNSEEGTKARQDLLEVVKETEELFKKNSSSKRFKKLVNNKKTIQKIKKLHKRLKNTYQLLVLSGLTGQKKESQIISDYDGQKKLVGEAVNFTNYGLLLAEAILDEGRNDIVLDVIRFLQSSENLQKTEVLIEYLDVLWFNESGLKKNELSYVKSEELKDKIRDLILENNKQLFAKEEYFSKCSKKTIRHILEKIGTIKELDYKNMIQRIYEWSKVRVKKQIKGLKKKTEIWRYVQTIFDPKMLNIVLHQMNFNSFQSFIQYETLSKDELMEISELNVLPSKESSKHFEKILTIEIEKIKSQTSENEKSKKENGEENEKNQKKIKELEVLLGNIKIEKENLEKKLQTEENTKTELKDLSNEQQFKINKLNNELKKKQSSEKDNNNSNKYDNSEIDENQLSLIVKAAVKIGSDIDLRMPLKTYVNEFYEKTIEFYQDTFSHSYKKFIPYFYLLFTSSNETINQQIKKFENLDLESLCFKNRYDFSTLKKNTARATIKIFRLKLEEIAKENQFSEDEEEIEETKNDYEENSKERRYHERENSYGRRGGRGRGRKGGRHGRGEKSGRRGFKKERRGKFKGYSWKAGSFQKDFELQTINILKMLWLIHWDGYKLNRINEETFNPDTMKSITNESIEQNEKITLLFPYTINKNNACAWKSLVIKKLN
ncbi:ring finger protein [Anaeramoeba flamelloides]|uniref:Ring finger protein n=1 Tax=Anaeramoeba flamelloides TaxID=1746091 RepID=A0ABQ8Z5I1_9EUKA|nr:ring finger protein [Anaeramoeba flamelloides]